MRKFADSVQAFVLEWTVNIVILLFGTTTLVQAFIVPTSSMEGTVLVGDHLFVDKLAYSPPGAFSKHLLPYTEVQRGDIIVFRWPMDISQNYVKRAVGIPGDRIRIENKKLFVNGQAMHEPYLQHIDPHNEPYRDNFPAAPYGPVNQRALRMLEECVKDGELVVPAGYYFAMGDNRENSLDSRYWGLVPRENIIGKPVLIFWSYDAPTEHLIGENSAHYVDLAKNFFAKTRWERTFRLIRPYSLGSGARNR
jgi:signal peptidase I